MAPSADLARLREAAEYPNAFAELRPGQERIDTGRFTLCLERDPQAATVQRQRIPAGEIDAALAEARTLLRARGRSRTQWEVGSSAGPAGLTEALLDRGLVRDSEPFATALALTTAPPAAPAELTARPVAGFDEYVAARDVQRAAFAMPAERTDAEHSALRAEWEEAPQLLHAVWHDGELVGAGACARTPFGLALFGGAALPAHRGHGVYRALISARWRQAERDGLGALLTQAGAMSCPILTRLGFVVVGHVDMLVDAFAAP